MKFFSKILPIILISALSYWSIKPLLNTGFFPMHDDTQVARVFEMHKSLSDGMFPVRWVADLGYGYGYPIFNFYAPLVYYIGALFMFLGFNALLSTKLMIGLGIILAGIFMYFLAKEFWGKVGGIVASMLYLYAPYHALNVYVRGAIAELWAYAFIPLAFLATYKVYSNISDYIQTSQKSSKLKVQVPKLQLKVKSSIWNWVCVAALSYAGIILSHNLTAMMVTPFLFIFAAFLYLKIRMGENIYKPHYVLLGLLLGILLSAFYWLPIPFEMKYTDVLSVVGGGSDYGDHFVCISQLWNSAWGFGGSVPGCIDGLSFKIGKLHIVLGIISLFAITVLLRKEKTKLHIAILFIIFLLISLFLTLKESKPVWDSVVHMAFFQFPWRFLVLISFFLSFLGGAAVLLVSEIKLSKNLTEKAQWVVGGILVAAIIFVNADVFRAQSATSVNSNQLTSKNDLNWRVSKISDEYMPKGFFKPLRAIDVPNSKIEVNKDIKVLSVSEKTQQVKFIVDAKNNTTIYMNIAYFPGWHVFVDGNQVWFKYSGHGFMIDIPKGKHTVDVKFTQTPVEKAGDVLSLTGVMVLLAGIISHRKKVKHDKKTS